MKKVTVALEDELWSRVHEEAAEKRISVNAFILEVLSSAVRKPNESTGERLANFAEMVGPAPQSWTWDRTEIYEDAMLDKPR